MKIPLLLLSLASCGFAGPAFTTRITAEALGKLQDESKSQQVKLITAPAIKAKQSEPQSLISSSCILQDGTHWTLVPKTAVIFSPASLKDRVDAKPVGTLLPWVEFLAANRSWITTAEISLEQAAGSVALPPERIAFWQKQKNIVVATHLTGPISIKLANTPQP